MAIDSIIGQNRVKKIIESALERGRLAHAYLFHGPAGVGKDAIAVRLAMGLNCQEKETGGCGKCHSCLQLVRLEHPGFKFIMPLPSRPKSMNQEKYLELVREKKLERIENAYREVSFAPAITALPNIGIEQIRALKQEVILKQQSGRTRVFIISQAEYMTIPAANSLLKLLEEPPPGTVLFLTTSAPGRILPTIASRCQNIRFDALCDSDIETALKKRWDFEPGKARFFSRMANGSIQRALALAEEDFESMRHAAWEFLSVSLGDNHLKRMAECDTFIDTLQKKGIQSMFQLLLAWLRDLLCIQSGLPEKMINADRQNELEEFLKIHRQIDLEAALGDTEHAIASLQKNVYLSLIVHTLSQRLNRNRAVKPIQTF